MRRKWVDRNHKQVLERAAGKALRTIGIVIGGDAIARAAIDTGRFKGSLTYATQTTKSSPRAPATQADAVSIPTDKLTLHIGTNVEYGPHLEYGTRKMPAQPSLRPAFDARKRDAKRIMADAIKEAYRSGR